MAAFVNMYIRFTRGRVKFSFYYLNCTRFNSPEIQITKAGHTSRLIHERAAAAVFYCSNKRTKCLKNNYTNDENNQKCLAQFS